MIRDCKKCLNSYFLPRKEKLKVYKQYKSIGVFLGGFEDESIEIRSCKFRHDMDHCNRCIDFMEQMELNLL